jgi:two-component system NtrC family response regulator
MENRVKRAVVLAEGNRIVSTDLGFVEDDHGSQSLNLREARERVESEVIQRALSIYNNNVTHAAEALGISRPSLYSLIKKLDIPEPGK